MAVAHVLYPTNGQADRNFWVNGTTNATAYPTNGFGGGTATNTSSILANNANGVFVVGILVTTTAAVTVSVVDHDGSAIPGMVLSSPAVGYYPIGLWYKATGTGGSNVGIACGASALATLIYRA